MDRPKKAIGIRLPSELERHLREEAAKRNLKPTTYATQVLTEALASGGDPLEKRLSEMQALLESLDHRLEVELPRKLKAIVEAASTLLAPRSPKRRPTDRVEENSGREGFDEWKSAMGEAE